MVKTGLRRILEKGYQLGKRLSDEKTLLVKKIDRLISSINSKIKKSELGPTISDLLFKISKNEMFGNNDVFLGNLNAFVGRKKLSNVEGELLWVVHSKDFESFKDNEVSKVLNLLNRQITFIKYSMDFLSKLPETNGLVKKYTNELSKILVWLLDIIKKQKDFLEAGDIVEFLNSYKDESKVKILSYSQISRRRFVKITGAAGVGVLVGGYAVLDKLLSDESKEKVQYKALNTIRKLFRINIPELEQKLLSGKEVNPKEVSDAFIKKEINEFIKVRKSGRAHSWLSRWKNIVKGANEIYKEIEDLSIKDIEEIYFEGKAIDERLAHLIKVNIVFNELMEDGKGNLRYRKNKGNIIDTIATGEFQCDSGTDLFLCLAFELLSPHYVKDMVYVNQITNGGGHAKPGIIIDETLYNVELTQNGINLENNGKIGTKKGPIVVLKTIEGKVDELDGVYDPELRSIVYINGMKPNSESIMLPPGFKFLKSPYNLYIPGPTARAIIPANQPNRFSELNKEFEEACRKLSEALEREQGLNKGMFSREVRRGMAPKYSKETTIPTFDWKKLYKSLKSYKGPDVQKTRAINSYTDSGSSRTFRTRKYAGGSSKEKGLGELYSKARNAAERGNLREYERTHRSVQEYWNEHAAILNSNASNAKKYNQLKELFDRMNAEWKRKDYEGQRRWFNRFCKREGLRDHETLVDTYNRISHNMSVIKKRAGL